MLQITPQHQFSIAVAPVDFRKGIDGLAALCKQQLQHDPFSGRIFVFRNKRCSSIKLLVYDGNGFWLCQKRFSQGKLAWWPSQPQQADDIRAIELLLILQQGVPEQAKVPPSWRRLT